MQDNAGKQYLLEFWCRVAGSFLLGPHMAYSSASDVKSFAFFVNAVRQFALWLYCAFI